MWAWNARRLLESTAGGSVALFALGLCAACTEVVYDTSHDDASPRMQHDAAAGGGAAIDAHMGAGGVGGGVDARDSGWDEPEPMPTDGGLVNSEAGTDASHLEDAGPDASHRACCSTGDCLCHSPPPTEPLSEGGPFRTESFSSSVGTIDYPVDASPPFATLAFAGGFAASSSAPQPWGEFYASYGFVVVTVDRVGSDVPDVTADKVSAAIETLKELGNADGNPLSDALSDRFGVLGYSLSGGVGLIAARADPSLRAVVGIAPWEPTGEDVQVPSLFICGEKDATAPCDMSQRAYADIPESTPKMSIEIEDGIHFPLFVVPSRPAGTSHVAARFALAFLKVFLEGDSRWKPYLLDSPDGAATTTNIR